MIIKTAAELSKDSAQQYLQSKLGKGTINLITPSLIGMAIRRMFGFTVIGFGIDFLLRLMGVDFEKIISDACSSVVSAASSDEKISPERVDQIVEEKVNSAFSTVKKSGYNPMLKIAASGASATALSSTSPIASSFLKKSLSFVMKASLAAIGMELFVDFVAKPIIGEKTDWSGMFSFLSMKRVSNQKKFLANKNISDMDLSSSNGRVDAGSVPVTPDHIKAILIKWANEVYPTVDNSALSSSVEMEKLVQKIYSYNYKIVNLVDYFFIPKDFGTKKDVVDYFIDDVAARSSTPEIKSETKSDQKK